MTPYRTGYDAGLSGAKPGDVRLPFQYTTGERMDFWEGFREARRDLKDMAREPLPNDPMTSEEARKRYEDGR
jgi:ribosome modulation factor